MSLAQISAQVRSGERTAVTVAAEAIERLKGLSELNLISWMDAEMAHIQARAVDAAVAAGGEVGVLAGVPVALKDNLAFAGAPLECGSPALAGHHAVDNATVVDRLSDRVQHWMTLNEPQCFIGLGLLEGTHAPGDKLGLADVLRAGHHALLAHGRSVQVIRARAKSQSVVGYAPTGTPVMPQDENDAENIEVARRAMFAVKNRNCWNISWWSDPVILGHYPEDGLAIYGPDAPRATADDFEIMCQPLDFYGTNVYHGWTIGRNTRGKFRNVGRAQGHAVCANKWPVTPEALYWGPRFYYERYKLPIVITENGLSCQDWVSVDGQVHDPQRIDFTTRYLRELGRAGEDGVPIEGYFHWSAFDNFEWAEGYNERFGLIYVAYQTQQRILKDSARWYRGVIESNGATLAE